VIDNQNGLFGEMMRFDIFLFNGIISLKEKIVGGHAFIKIYLILLYIAQ
jgi:hypothetical protein